MAISRWASLADGLSFLGDNLASLNLALSGKAKGKLNNLAKELALRIAKEDLQYSVRHLPAGSNTLADTLSRVAQPGSDASMPEALLGAAEVTLGPLCRFWSL